MAEIATVSAIRQLVEQELREFVAASNAFGGAVRELGEKVNEAFALMLEFVRQASSMANPGEAEVRRMLQPLSSKISEIQEFRDSNRHEDMVFNHLSMISESIIALSWVAAYELPAVHVRNMKEAGDYFGNRVLLANRNSQKHMDWVTKWQAVLTSLERIIREFHLQGLRWNVGEQGNVAGNLAQGGQVAPPPPPPPPSDDIVGMARGDNPRVALFEQINSEGVNITQLLRPVRTLQLGESQGHIEVPIHRAEHPAVLAPPPRPNPPRIWLDDKKWRVENVHNDPNIIINNTDMAHCLAVYKCEDVTVNVMFKLNGATIDNVKRSKLLFKDVISAVELIRCTKVVIDCAGNVPTIQLDNCSCSQIFVAKDSLGVELITSQCTSINVCIWQEDGSYIEYPVPEQLRHVIVNGKLHTTPVLLN